MPAPKAKSKSKALPPKRGSASKAEINSEIEGTATAADAALAAELSATAKNVKVDVTLNFANLLRNPALIVALRTYAKVFDAEEAGTVEENVERRDAFVEHYGAYMRFAISSARLHDHLVKENKNLKRFLTAVVSRYKKAGKGDPMRLDQALQELAADRQATLGHRKGGKKKK